MTGSLRVALISGMETTGYGIRLCLDDCPIQERPAERLSPYIDMDADEASKLAGLIMRLLIESKQKKK